MGINSLLGRKVRSPAPSSILIGEETETDPQIIANTFNDFYASVAEQIRAEIPRNPRSFSTFLKNPIPRNLFLSPVTKMRLFVVFPTLIPLRLLDLIVFLPMFSVLLIPPFLALFQSLLISLLQMVCSRTG